MYDFIDERIRRCGYSPTIREIGLHLGVRSTNGVADHLKALKRKGYLSQIPTKSRTWQPLQKPSSSRVKGRVAVPLLGRVAAGEPILAEEQALDVLQIDAALLPKGREVFALKVAGDSMIEAGILHGDIIFVDKRNDAAPGSIVVVVIDDAATVKHYYPEGDKVRLQPANRTMRSLTIHAHEARQVQIMGVVVGVYRRL